MPAFQPEVQAAHLREVGVVRGEHLRRWRCGVSRTWVAGLQARVSASQKAPVVPSVPSDPAPIIALCSPAPPQAPCPMRTSQLAPATLSPFFSTLVLGSEAEMTSWWAAALPMASPNPGGRGSAQAYIQVCRMLRAAWCPADSPPFEL